LQLWDIRTYGLVKTFDWKNNDPDGSTSIYSCKFVKPHKNAVIACGANQNSVKIFSTDSGDLLHSLTEIDPIIG
jgi:WD40 repeat protein